MTLRAIRLGLWALVAVSAVLAGALWWMHESGEPARFASTQPAAYGDAFGGPFELVDQHGNSVTEAALLGKPTALFFGFTHCPDVCPTTLFEMSRWSETVDPSGDSLNVVFISVDPERDTPDALASYMSAFSDRIVALTGEPDVVRDVLRRYKIYSRKVGDGEDYTMDHTASVFLLDAAGRFRGTVAHGESRDTALAKLGRLIEETGT